MNRWVDITFDCLPLRSVGRLDIPIDASPKFRERILRIKNALEKHGSHNTYYLHSAQCTFHLTNHDELGMVQFSFEGTVLTDIDDQQTKHADLIVNLASDTCTWLTEPIVKWFSETVSQAICVEFDRYIAAGDLDQAKQRIEKIQAASDDVDGFVGMYL